MSNVLSDHPLLTLVVTTAFDGRPQHQAKITYSSREHGCSIPIVVDGGMESTTTGCPNPSTCVEKVLKRLQAEVDRMRREAVAAGLLPAEAP